MDFNGCLAEMRGAFGKNARKLTLPPKPRWLKPDDGLSALYEEFPRLVGSGGLYWGALVQANTMLFEPPAGTVGSGSLADILSAVMDKPLEQLFGRKSEASVAEILYNHRQSPEADFSPEKLKTFAHYLYELKGRDESECPDWLSRAVGVVKAEYSRERVVITVGEQDDYDNNVTMQSVIVFREHLPRGVLKPALLPLIAAPDSCESAMLLPCGFWSKDYKRYWNSAK